MKASPNLRRLLCLILCFIMVLQPMTSIVARAESANLLVNGDFSIDADGDNKADGWTYWYGTAIEAASSIGEDGLSEAGRTGQTSLFVISKCFFHGLCLLGQNLFDFGSVCLFKIDSDRFSSPFS